VTWQTDRPATRASFVVLGRPSPPDPFPLDEAFEEGRGRTRFSVRLRAPRELRDLGDIVSVVIRVMRARPPFDQRTVVVPVSG
jgi:hypothetical protein